MKPTIVFLDHDRDSVNEIIEDLNKRRTVSKPHVAMAEQFDLRPLILSATPKPEQIADLARDEIRKIRPRAVLVDLNFAASTDQTTWRRGAEIAKRVRADFPDLPIGVYSQFAVLPADRIRLSEYRFSVVLEELNQIMKVAKREFTNSDWITTFQNLVRHSTSAEFPAVFVSHAHADQALAEAITDLLLHALPIARTDIVASSVGGAGLPAGSSLPEVLLGRISRAECVVALLTDRTIGSQYVWYELGVANATTAGKVIVVGTRSGLEGAVRSPIAHVVALRCFDRTDLLRFLGAVRAKLALELRPPEDYERYLKAVLDRASETSDV